MAQSASVLVALTIHVVHALVLVVMAVAVSVGTSAAVPKAAVPWPSVHVAVSLHLFSAPKIVFHYSD